MSFPSETTNQPFSSEQAPMTPTPEAFAAEPTPKTEPEVPAAPEAQAEQEAPEAYGHQVGDEIAGLGVVAGVRRVAGDGEYVQIGSPDAEWIKV